jgi:ribosomal protein L44E
MKGQVMKVHEMTYCSVCHDKHTLEFKSEALVASLACLFAQIEGYCPVCECKTTHALKRCVDVMREIEAL